MAGTRLSRVAETKSRRQALIYIILSVAFVLGMIKWGVPGFIRLLAWWSGADKTVTVGTGPKIRPQAPAMTPLPEATFSATLRVSGVAQPGVRIKLFSNGIPKDEQDTDLDGNFSFNAVPLLAGKNTIGVQAINKNDLESEITQTDVAFDNEPPALEVSEPADESDFFGATQKNVQIKGTMKERGVVYINGNYVSTATSGDFNYRLSLSPGMNEITVIATDEAGNQSSKLIRLRYTQ